MVRLDEVGDVVRGQVVIVDLIVSALLAGLDALTSLLPTVTIPVGSQVHVGSLAVELGRVVPVAQIILGLSACIGLRLVMYGWDLVVWVYHQFWGSG